MTRFGKIASKDIDSAIPVGESPYTLDEQVFLDVDILRFEYRTDADAVASVVPDVFEVPDAPKAFVSFNKWGFSTVGQYLEVVQSVECRYRDETFFYPVRLYLNNDRAIAAGREAFGIPKLGAEVDMKNTNLLSGTLERPEGIRLASGVFQADRLITDDIDAKVINWGMRVIPRAGKSPTRKELIPYDMVFKGGSLWAGVGSVHLTGASAIDPLHQIPVLEMVGSTYMRSTTMRLVSGDPVSL
jgi:acetoacetate decarboxylase